MSGFRHLLYERNYCRCPKSECSVWKTKLNLARILDIRAVWFARSFGYTINVQNPNKSERSVGRVDQPNVRNPNKIVWISDVVRNLNDSTSKPKRKAPKSECSDFGRSLYCFCKRAILTLKWFEYPNGQTLVQSNYQISPVRSHWLKFAKLML